jgi:hypothetical protein
MAKLYHTRPKKSLHSWRREGTDPPEPTLPAVDSPSTSIIPNSRSTKRKYSEFIFKITDNELPIFLSKKKLAEIENDDQAE